MNPWQIMARAICFQSPLTRNEDARVVRPTCFTHDKISYASATKIVPAQYRGMHTTVAFNATVACRRTWLSEEVEDYNQLSTVSFSIDSRRHH